MTTILAEYLTFVANNYGVINSQQGGGFNSSAHGETDFANNTFAVPITITAPDLTVTAATEGGTAAGMVAASVVLAFSGGCGRLLTTAPDDGDLFDAPLPGLTPAEHAAFVEGDEQGGSRHSSAHVGDVARDAVSQGLADVAHRARIRQRFVATRQLQ